MTTPTPPPTTTTTPTPDAPLTLWLTDRTRYKLGTARCPRARYLGSHFGPTGYGITARRESLPLVTGISVHRGLEGFATILAEFDRLPDIHETRAIIAETTADYIARVELRGYRGILSNQVTEETIREQAALISGLLWALRLKFLPWLHQGYRVLVVERERLHFLSCACGAPPLDPTEHIRRQCSGQALMLRTDLIAQRRSGQSLAYFEAKTTGWDSDAWVEQWETDAQLGLGTLDTHALYGGDVTELYIVGLSKGRRTKDRFDPEQPKRQMSPLCYGYARPANPPLQSEDWLPSYEWTNDSGEVKRASRAHRRKGVWLLGDSDWPMWRAYKGTDPDLTPEEFWVRFLPVSVLEKCCFILGPMNRQDEQLASLLRSMAGEESRWQETLWALYELQQRGWSWRDTRFQAELDRLVPCSWACRPFGKEHQCEFVPICHRHQGWDDPLGSGHYQPRLPHHQPELQQAIARGLLPAEAAEVDEEEL
jgi:hypothetical protein